MIVTINISSSIHRFYDPTDQSIVQPISHHHSLIPFTFLNALLQRILRRYYDAITILLPRYFHIILIIA